MWLFGARRNNAKLLKLNDVIEMRKSKDDPLHHLYTTGLWADQTRANTINL
jgi:hypothetical protein